MLHLNLAEPDRKSVESSFEGLNQESFLSGDEERDIIVDPLMASTWRSAKADLLTSCDMQDSDIDQQGRWLEGFPCLGRYEAQSGCFRVLAIKNRIHDFEVGVIAVEEAPGGKVSLAGLYCGPCLCVHPDRRDLGIGSALVVAQFIRSGQLPTWSLDVAAYSPAGERTHRKAFIQLKDILSAPSENIDVLDLRIS